MQVSRAWRQGEFASVRDVFHPSLPSAGQNVRKTASQGRNYHATFAQGRIKLLTTLEFEIQDTTRKTYDRANRGSNLSILALINKHLSFLPP